MPSGGFRLPPGGCCFKTSNTALLMEKFLEAFFTFIGSKLTWLAALFLLLFYCLCVNHVSINTIGAAYDSWDGTVACQHPGFHLTSPTVLTMDISTLPMPVTIVSRSRVLNVRMVRFKPEGLEEYIRVQGFSWLDGAQEDQVFNGYAFSGKKWSFLEVQD